MIIWPGFRTKEGDKASSDQPPALDLVHFKLACSRRSESASVSGERELSFYTGKKFSPALYYLNTWNRLTSSWNWRQNSSLPRRRS